MHKRSVHENLFFECEQREYKASQKGNLKTHIHVIHEGGKRKSTKSIIVKETCTVCGKNFRKEYLKEHTERRHLGRGFRGKDVHVMTVIILPIQKPIFECTLLLCIFRPCCDPALYSHSSHVNLIPKCFILTCKSTFCLRLA
jgi:hypothetical protein